jgi:hypothetical protein
MKWFNKWILNRVKAAQAAQVESDHRNMEAEVAMASNYTNGIGSLANVKTATISKSQDLDHDNTIRFNVFPASGGRVVQTHRYDRQRDRSITGLYVVTSDQDFGKEIDKIITMEALK